MGKSWRDELNDAEKIGRIGQMVEDLHAMHTNGGCSNVKLLKNSIWWLRLMMFAVVSAVTGWLGFIHIKVDHIQRAVTKLSTMMGG